VDTGFPGSSVALHLIDAGRLVTGDIVADEWVPRRWELLTGGVLPWARGMYVLDPCVHALIDQRDWVWRAIGARLGFVPRTDQVLGRAR
jgi:hypothetical protein